MLTPKFLAASLVAFNLTDLSHAREPASPPSIAAYEQFDRNADGVLSYDEVVATEAIATRFEKFDLDRDGRLDRSEFRALLANLRRPHRRST
jgi:hypothetical protein